jgi:hypothetical protein
MVRSGWGAGPGDRHGTCSFSGSSSGFATTTTTTPTKNRGCAPKKNKDAKSGANVVVQDSQRKKPKAMCHELAKALQDWQNDCMNNTYLCRLLEQHGLSVEGVEWRPKPTVKALSASKRQLEQNSSSSSSGEHDGKLGLQGQVKTNCLYAPGCKKHDNMKQAVRAVLVDGASITELTAKRFETSARTLRA